MVNTFQWHLIRTVQRLSMILTLGCCAYLAYFWLSQDHDHQSNNQDNELPLKSTGPSLSAPVLDLKLTEAAAFSPGRDIFSVPVAASAVEANKTPKGQLPDNLKIVGILISNPSQIIIEDTVAKQTYFITETTPQNGIKIVQVKNDQMIINYQGQDIPVAINKN